jgi:hypothetical protein
VPVLRFAGCLAGFFVPVCVAGAVLCLWVSAGAALWVCALGVAVGVCVPVGVCACLCALCLWCALLRCLCAVWQVLPCVLLWVSALWSALVCCACSAGVCFVNKNKGLQCFLNEKDYMRFYLPINFLIISIMCLPLFDYIDNIMSIISMFFCVQKTPPSKSFGSYFFSQG